MNHTEHAYIEAGRRYELAQTVDAGRALAEKLRAMLAGEDPKDRAEARALIERGRADARSR